MSIKVLIAEDEKNIADAIAYSLKREQYDVTVTYNGEDALHSIQAHKPDVLILDIMMPKLNGYDLCRQINHIDMGIIMLTAKTELIDKVLGLELGADDYMTKPFEMQELIARVRSLSRRMTKTRQSEVNTSNSLRIQDFSIQYDERTVRISGEEIELKPKEYELLEYLLQNINKTFTRDMILEQVWGMSYYGSTRTIDIHIQRIRKKLGLYGSLIKTVTKVGYKAVPNFD